ncbi:hypothetical protein OHW01_00070 [Acinetobacter baumannii]|nr:hypothetical protein [Acinetobacter baumannii]
MDKKALQEQFEQTKTYELCKSWQIDFDEKAEIYYSINPAYHNDVIAINAAWSMFQEQQAKVEELETKLKQAYEDVDTFATAHEALEQRVDRDRSLIQFTQKANKDLIANRDELQNRVDAIAHLIRGLRAEFDLWVDVECPQVERQIELLEQALKGEEQ